MIVVRKGDMLSSLKGVTAGIDLSVLSFSCRRRLRGSKGGRSSSNFKMGASDWRRRPRQGATVIFRRRRSLGNVVADRTRGSCGLAGLFCGSLQGSAGPKGRIWRSTDPRIRQCGGQHRLLHFVFRQGWRDQNCACALQLYVREARQRLAHCGPPFLDRALGAEITFQAPRCVDNKPDGNFQTPR